MSDARKWSEQWIAISLFLTRRRLLMHAARKCYWDTHSEKNSFIKTFPIEKLCCFFSSVVIRGVINLPTLSERRSKEAHAVAVAYPYKLLWLHGDSLHTLRSHFPTVIHSSGIATNSFSGHYHPPAKTTEPDII